MALDLATLQARYADVDQALHDLQMGRAVVDVWRDGRRITYAKADLTSLKDYRLELATQIAAVIAGGDPNAISPRGSMRPMFSGCR